MKPKAPIRRFDIFAEYNRQKAVAEGMAADVAAGYGIWLAKVVAARRFGRKRAETSRDEDRESKERPSDELVGGKWRTLSGEPQTEELFQQQIVDRMGRQFYRRVLVPAIRQALREGKEYAEIRDSLRKDWKPE